MYASVTANTAGMNSPCTKRHTSSAWSVVAPAAANVTSARPKIALTITRLRPIASAIGPTNGAASAHANVRTEIVAPTAASPV